MQHQDEIPTHTSSKRLVLKTARADAARLCLCREGLGAATASFIAIVVVKCSCHFADMLHRVKIRLLRLHATSLATVFPLAPHWFMIGKKESQRWASRKGRGQTSFHRPLRAVVHHGQVMFDKGEIREERFGRRDSEGEIREERFERRDSSGEIREETRCYSSRINTGAPLGTNKYQIASAKRPKRRIGKFVINQPILRKLLCPALAPVRVRKWRLLCCDLLSKSNQQSTTPLPRPSIHT